LHSESRPISQEKPRLGVCEMLQIPGIRSPQTGPWRRHSLLLCLNPGCLRSSPRLFCLDDVLGYLVFCAAVPVRPGQCSGTCRSRGDNNKTDLELGSFSRWILTIRVSQTGSLSSTRIPYVDRHHFQLLHKTFCHCMCSDIIRSRRTGDLLLYKICTNIWRGLF
jgi:hypothetical protein